MLINKKEVRKFALDVAKRNRPKFTRVSKEFLIHCEGVLKERIIHYIQSLPSIGKTIK